jgi:DNA-binding response OmpR family regulator
LKLVIPVMTSADARSNASARGSDTVLLVEREVLVRTSIAEYLRACGFRTLEARDAREAGVILGAPSESVDIVLSDAASGFELSRWIRANRPQVKIVVGGTVDRLARIAAELCDSGPTSSRPYDPQLLVQRIKALLGKD